MTDVKKRGRKGVLSVAIDPLLFQGGRRINEIAELLVTQFNGQYTKPQLVNNIRSRITALTRNGFTIERDTVERRRIRLVAPVVAETVSPANV